MTIAEAMKCDVLEFHLLTIRGRECEVNGEDNPQHVCTCYDDLQPETVTFIENMKWLDT